MSKTTATVIAELINKKFPQVTTLCIWSEVDRDYLIFLKERIKRVDFLL